MTYDEIRRDIKAQKYKPIYFLCGEEPFFIDSLTRLLEDNILPEEEKAFNQTVLYGNDVTMGTVTDTARRFPMMAERQVVIVREAQNIRDFDNLTPYIDHFQPATVLVLAYKNKKPDQRKSVFKKLKSSSNCVYFESAKLYDNKIPEWITGYCKEQGYRITAKAAGILADSLGTDLSRIANEIDKLALHLAKGGEINEALVEEHTGISKDFNSFELRSAIIRKDFVKANLGIDYRHAVQLFSQPADVPLREKEGDQPTRNSEDFRHKPLFPEGVHRGWQGIQRHEVRQNHFPAPGIRHDVQRRGECQHRGGRIIKRISF